MRSVNLAGLLAEPERLRTFAAIVLGATQPEQIATDAGLSVGTVRTAVRRLQVGGLVTTGPGGFEPVADAFKDATRADRPEREPLDDDPATDALLQACIRDGRITTMPTFPAKQKVVIGYLARLFEPDRDYPESEVNEILHAWYDDHAQLRRFLVDWGFLTRANSTYRKV
ncbi:DUF2087 domain-containing protein [Kribbella sp. NBC_01245]|uniref:DUF2087 domain-containing protein n=1 Tax=Kribbella sp. NBC_01245 TaxID=2903578 RepID=UPI002E2C14FE|nr:DUF2087 domain-containing protein [Kribbella sp. NBC_01245]